jgi:hypothetical protein
MPFLLLRCADYDRAYSFSLLYRRLDRFEYCRTHNHADLRLISTVGIPFTLSSKFFFHFRRQAEVALYAQKEPTLANYSLFRDKLECLRNAGVMDGALSDCAYDGVVDG